MFSVKRLEPETILSNVELPCGIALGKKTPKAVTFGVVDDQGIVVKSSRGQYEIYPRRWLAEKAATHLNDPSNAT